ncbi:U3 small nucleolar RNA-associated protein [Macrolepiota fuliginosa MF-IS2]|uniref:U3 small nucleolar RNA-associated protein n=1 Tax=Macrolepiota fuliginosa MF-IS2 TaxID=1400762 RepID=A0A9P5XQX9_9AGAR|nr:U3 small nucleolar RNA-associated protein [Macrolepiota fuliginosa MF-IS2]
MAIGQVRPSFKTAFKNVRSLGPLYTSGPIAFTPDGLRIVTCVGEDVLLTDVETGTEICRFVGDSQTIHSLCATPSSSHLVTFSASLSLRIYELPTTPPENKRVQPIRTIARAHDSPVHVCKVDPTSTYLASGSADGVVKVWDIHRGFVTHLFKGHGGVVSALAFHFPRDASSLETPTMRLITASVDTHIRIFNLTSGASTSSAGGKPEVVLEGHVSVPRGLDVSQDGRWLISAGRDSVALIWDLYAKGSTNQSTKKKASTPSIRPALAKTITVLERAEAVGFLPTEQKLPVANGENNLIFYTGGSKGVIKIRDGQSGEVLWRSGEELETADDSEEQRQIVDVLYVPSSSTLASVHADQNILCYDLPTGKLRRQLIGYNDEIIDATFLSSSTSNETSTTYLALATNSSLIRVYATNTFDARLLEGHSDIVLALTSSGDGKLLASSSKDKTARIWISSTSGHSLDWGYQCIGVCEGHAESVGALAMPRRQGETEPLPFMFTGSQDRTIKMWDLTPLQGQPDGSPIAGVTRCHSLTTFKAHDKDINSLDVAPNNRLLVSGSQDKTAKIYEIIYTPGSKASAPRGELKLLGICKGHKRGVWTVKFSPTDRLVATGSGDKTVKLWNLDDLSCIKTFEGHTNSVLRVDFLTMGLQLVTSASDGLVKVWNIQDEECVTTLDNHEDKVWALAVGMNDRTLVSGAADSVVTFWEDSTEAEAAEKESKRAEMVVKDQDFLNYVALRDYRKALELALAMNQPGRLYSLFKDLASSAAEESSTMACTGNALVDEVIRTLATPDLAQLLSFVRNWNSNAKTSDVAQRVLFAIVKLRSSDDVIRVFEDEKAARVFLDAEEATSSTGKSGMMAIKELIEAIVPYTERHLSKVDRLLQESYVIDYILGEMDDGMFDADDADSRMEVEVY